MFSKSATCILLACLILSCFIIFGESKKKANMVINFKSGVMLCDTESGDFVDPSGLRAMRHNETIAVMNGTFRYKQKLDGKLKLVVAAEKVLLNGAKELITAFEVQDFCEELKNKGRDTIVGKYLSAVDFPPECPIHAGTYTINEMAADIKYLPIDYVKEGLYTLTMTIFSYKLTGSGFLATTSNVNKLACMYFDISIEKGT